MKYAFNIALVTLAATAPIVDLPRDHVNEKRYSKRQDPVEISGLLTGGSKMATSGVNNLNGNGQQSTNPGGFQSGLGQLLGATSIGGADGELLQSEGIAGLLGDVGNLADLNDAFSSEKSGSMLGEPTGCQNPDTTISKPTRTTTGGTSLSGGGNMNSECTDSTTGSTQGTDSRSTQTATAETQVSSAPLSSAQTGFTNNSFQGTPSYQQPTVQAGAGSSLTLAAISKPTQIMSTGPPLASAPSQAPATIQTPTVPKTITGSTQPAFATGFAVTTQGVGDTQAVSLPAAASATPLLG